MVIRARVFVMTELGEAVAMKRILGAEVEVGKMRKDYTQ